MSSLTVPTGWKLVPEAPTEEMVEAACCAADNGSYSGEYLRRILRAVIAAAPEVESAKPKAARTISVTADVLRDAMARYRSAQDVNATEFSCVRAAVEPILEAAEWQPIDTAPKTTLPIILMPGRGIYRDVIRAPVVGHWCEHQECWVSWETGRTIERSPVAWREIPDYSGPEEGC